ncbi:unnamed protein product [Arctia plantaginis]|uniref:Uncharacterized protein n=1 Tax=Arctia plantaginis TaxID=874455 RepID=A0A8S1A766_ARCPL|nr:unnamed protein product [Arctia plantaginis]
MGVAAAGTVRGGAGRAVQGHLRAEREGEGRTLQIHFRPATSARHASERKLAAASERVSLVSRRAAHACYVLPGLHTCP